MSEMPVPAWPFSPLARLAPIEKRHAPIFRWRWKPYKDFQRAWQYVDPATDQEALNLYNISSAQVEVQAVTAAVAEDALQEAFEAGIRFEKFGNPADQLYARLGYRRCSRRRANTQVT